MKNKTLLGIPLSSLSWEETEKRIQAIFRGKSPPQQIVTLNNEMLLEAEQNPRFKALLQTTWNLPDGVGLTYLWRLVHGERLHRLPGADLAERILELAQVQQQSVYLVGGEHIEQPLQDFFRRKFPRLKLLGHQETTNLEPIKKHRPDLLMVCLGAPKQEFLIQDIRKGCPEIKLCIGLGGTFDFWAEKNKTSSNAVARGRIRMGLATAPTTEPLATDLGGGGSSTVARDPKENCWEGGRVRFWDGEMVSLLLFGTRDVVAEPFGVSAWLGETYI